MQILRSGDIVRARRRTWRVVNVHPYDACQVVSLCGTGTDGSDKCELLTPFDLLDVLHEPSATPRRVTTARWRRAARALIARSGVPSELRGLVGAAINILPHQLEPAVAVLRGEGCRLLLADDVGLGKTIQACVLIAELRSRGLARRAIVLTPPGLRDQWRHELFERFHIDATVADFRAVRQRMAEIPTDMNPWTTWPVAIASIDYVKRPDVLRAVLNTSWDVVVVDEAHRVANDGDRRQAASALASRAGYIVLLTATPHSGNTAAFEALCNLGSHGEQLLIFRRTRHVLASAVRRRIHRLRVRPTTPERRMYARLDAFARAIRTERGDGNRDMWIALALLQKRAYSSAFSLHLSVTRRLDTLAAASSPAAQLLLPLDEFGETSDDELPDWHAALGLADPEHEHRLLKALADAAADACLAESKIRAIRRLLRRIVEPIIIFTEYRDTLTWLERQLPTPSVLLHGGLSRTERMAALTSFTTGASRLLLATDAAGEGLNLHQRCRIVINLELPWNPMRLEQRIGRVDRIGQTRAVHAFHLIGAGTGELGLLDALRARIARAQADISMPDPLDGALDAGGEDSIRSHSVDVSDAARGLRLARTLATIENENGRPLIRKARNSQTRSRLCGLTLSLWECVLHDRHERIVSSYLVGVNAALSDDVETLSRCASVIKAASMRWQAVTLASTRAFRDMSLRRADAIVSAIGDGCTSPHQPGLFDRRVHFAHAAMKIVQGDALEAQRERIELLRSSGDVFARPPCLRLVLVS